MNTDDIKETQHETEKIISVDMSRPSDPKTIAKLDELLN